MGYRLSAAKNKKFYFKILPLSKENKERKLWRGIVPPLNSLSKYLRNTQFRFDAMLCSTLGDENFNAGHIKCERKPDLTPGP